MSDILYHRAVTTILVRHDFSEVDARGFQQVCSKLGNDWVSALLIAKHDGCTSVDEFMAHAEGNMPIAKKQRMATSDKDNDNEQR